jgi:hypothetical protein
MMARIKRWRCALQAPEQLSFNTLSTRFYRRRTIARYELHLAVDCLAKCIDEIKQDGADLVGVMMTGPFCDSDHLVWV